MMIEAVSAIPNVVESLQPAQSTSAGISQDFGSWFSKELGEVNSKLMQSESDSQSLAAGQIQNLHEVMIRMEEARHSFQLMLQVRNRLLEAYQEVMRTQV